MSRHIELLLSRRETFPINLCSGGCINSEKAIGERLYGFFTLGGGLSREVERGHREGEKRWDRIRVYGSWSVLIKMPSPQTGIGGSSPLHLWVTATEPG